MKLIYFLSLVSLMFCLDSFSGTNWKKFITQFSSGSENVIEMALSEVKWDLNTPIDDEGNTLLLYATKNSYPKLVDALLQRDADPNIKNNLGISALSIAIKTKNVEIVKLLLNYGANSSNLNIEDIDQYEMLKLLLEYGAFIQQYQNTNDDIRIERLLFRVNNPDIDCDDINSFSPEFKKLFIKRWICLKKDPKEIYNILKNADLDKKRLQDIFNNKAIVNALIDNLKNQTTINKLNVELIKIAKKNVKDDLLWIELAKYKN